MTTPDKKSSKNGCGIGCLVIIGLFVGVSILGKIFRAIGLVEDIASPQVVEEQSAESAPAAQEKAEKKVQEQPEESLDDIMAELDELVGLEGVKTELHRLINIIRVNEARKAAGLKVPEMNHHMIFTGNPGTGKTTVARIVARAFKAMGIVEKGQLVEVDRSNLVGQYTGETAVKTAAIIDKAMGGILFIDEAYQLVSGEKDNYGREALATLLKRMEDNRGDFVVIVAGYTDEMREFLRVNPGLKSRFAQTIEFADYTEKELAEIFRSMAKKNGFVLAEDLESNLESAMKKLTRNRDRQFGNARSVRQLIEDACGRQANRLAEENKFDRESLQTLILADLGLKEKKEDVRAPTIEEVLAELDTLTGMQSVKDEIRRLIATEKANKLREEKGLGNDVTMSYNFVFTGNPGTGKTTVARILGKAFRALGILETGRFIETDRSGLVAKYEGQTALKTNQLIDSAMGGVLFIDEAYQLNQGESDTYGSEAVATLLKRMEDGRGRIVVIIAGYKDEMKRFMDMNSGLESRFNRSVEFPDFTTDELGTIFRQMAAKANYRLSDDVEHWLNPYIAMLTANRDKHFGNGRWARNLFEKSIERQAIRVTELVDPSKEELMTLRMKDLGISLKNPDASLED